MEQQTYLLRFTGSEDSEASAYAQELKDILLDTDQNVKVDLTKDTDDTQDFGATLLIGILGTPAIIALANKIGEWLVLRHQAEITIETSDGKVVAKNLRARDAAGLTDKWLEKANNRSDA